MPVNYYCVCLLTYTYGPYYHHLLDCVTFPNPGKDPKGLEKCKERAKTLREMFAAQSDVAKKEAADKYKKAFGIPLKARITVMPIELKQIAE